MIARMNRLILSLPLVFLSPVLGLGQAPARVVANTPPPAQTDGVPRQGAGSLLAPDGQRLVLAQDPYAGGARLQPAAQTGAAADASAAAGDRAPGSIWTSVTPGNGNEPSLSPADQDLLRQTTSDVGAANRALLSAIQKDTVKRNDGLDVDPEGALVMAKIDPRTGKPRRRASEIARVNGLVMIPAGTILSIRAITRSQTQLAGTIEGVLEYDVLSSQMESVALPRGCKVLGAVQNVSGAAQDRAGFIFRQIVDPNGDQTQLLIPESAANSIGMAGIGPGDGATVNRHMGLKFGYAFAWGLLGGLTGSNSTSANSPGAKFSDTVRQNVAGSFGQVGQSALQEAMNIRSDIEVPQNASMKVILVNPIYLKPWRVLRPF